MARILLVDDEKDILEFLEHILAESYSVLKAQNGEQALELLYTEPVDLIVSDIVMPKMDGLELCKKLKASVDFCGIPIILLTAKNTIQAKVEGLEYGADAYIEKPFSKAYLLAQISSLLYNRNRVYESFVRPSRRMDGDYVETEILNDDTLFLESLNKSIAENMSNTRLDVDFLAREMAMSRSSFYRKVKTLSDLSPNELINLNRLRKASELLIKSQYRISEICERTGFGTRNSFNRIFYQHFKMTPSEYRKVQETPL